MRRFSTLLVWLLVLGSSALVPAVLAQEDPASADAASADAASAVPDDEFVPEGAAADDPSPANFDAIDDMLALDEEVMSDPDTYSYDPGARRDPFRSLLDRRTPASEATEERPDGPPGLLIDEIEIQGIFVLPEGPVAQIQSSSQETSYLLRQGDRLWDGDVMRITLDEVVFKQSVDDPTALKPFREVVKKLSP